MAHPVTLTLVGKPHLQGRTQELHLTQSKLTALLAYLALNDRDVTREELADLLWGGRAQSVRQALYTLRELPESDAWLDAGPTVKLHLTTDLHAARQAFARGSYEAALAPWQGDPDAQLLQGLDYPQAPDFGEWLTAERARTHDFHLEVLRGLSCHLEAEGQLDAAVAAARTWMTIDPLDEAAYRRVMTLEAAAGRMDAVLTVFEQCRRTLRSELDVEPGAETLACLAVVQQASSTGARSARLLRFPAQPPGLPEALYGREEQLRQARDLLSTRRSVLLQGMGGIGKTALAATLAAETLASGQAVLWLDLGDDAPDVAFDALASPLGARRQVAQGPPAVRSQALQQAIVQADVGLIVLDDAWNAYTLGRLREVLPEGVSLIVTARQRYAGLPRLSVDRLLRADALILLVHHAPAVNPHHPRADALCALLGDHPYAVRLAGITMHRRQLDPARLLQHLQGAPHALEQESDSILGLLDLSLERVSDPAYEAFFGLGALFAPRCSPELLGLTLRRGTEETELALYELVESGLATRESVPGQDTAMFRLHDLAWSYGQEKRLIRSQAVMRACLGYLGDHLNDPDGTELHLPNLVGAARYAAQQGADGPLVELALQLMVRATYLNARGASVIGREVVESALLAAERLDDPAALHDLWVVLGHIRRQLGGDLEAAHAAYRQALSYALTLGDFCRQAMTLSTIGRARAVAQPEEAERTLREALQLARASGDDGCLSLVLDGVGFMAAQQEDWARAHEHFSEALTVLDRLDTQTPAPDLDRRRFFALLNLGEAQLMLQQTESGLASKQQALTFARSRGYLQYEGHANFDLGQAWHLLGRPADAARSLQAALLAYSSLPVNTSAAEVLAFMDGHGYPRQVQ